MKGIRIRLPIDPFKQVNVKVEKEHEKHLPKDAKIDDGHVLTYRAFAKENKNQDYVLKYLPSSFSVEGFNVDYTNDREKLFPQVYIETEWKEKIYDPEKDHDIETVQEIKWKTDTIGKSKAKDWEFQEEYRYKVLVPYTLEEFKDIDEGEPEEKARNVTNLTQTLGRSGLIAEYFDIDLKEEALKQIHVTAGPRASQAQKKMIKLLLQDYFKIDNIDHYYSDSTFDIY